MVFGLINAKSHRHSLVLANMFLPKELLQGSQIQNNYHTW